MDYHETTFMRYLKRLKPRANLLDSSGEDADDTNTDEQETLENIGERVASILQRFDEININNKEEYIALKEEFRSFNFKEKDELIELASELLFRKALESSKFGFNNYYSFAVGLRRQSVVTFQKFIKRLIDLCDREVYALKQEFTQEMANPGQEVHLARVRAMIEDLFWRRIISAKAVVEYIHILLGIRSTKATWIIFELLSSTGAELDSIINTARLYISGMSKLGKNLDWFDDFKTLDFAFAELRNLSREQELSADLIRELKGIFLLRENNWKVCDESYTETWRGQNHYQERKYIYEPLPGSDDEDDTSDQDFHVPGANGITSTDSELAKYFGSLSIGIPVPEQVQNSLRNDLSSREYYFHSWLGDYHITPAKVAAITKSLYEYVHKPASTRFEVLFKVEKQATLQYVASPLVEAFLNLKLDNLSLAKSNVMWVERAVHYLLETKMISEAYCSGLSYLCTLLRVDWSLKEGTATQDAARTLESIRFEELKPKGQSIVWVARWMLDQTIQERHRESAQHLLKARDLDPEYWVWNYVIYNRLRFLRRHVLDRYGTMPDATEFEAILNAVELTPPGKLYHAMCISALCQCLADILRCRKNKGISGDPVDIRTQVLRTNSSIRDYIFEQAGNALEGKTEICFPEYVRYGEILSSILPYEYLNYDLAELCYMQCIAMKPRNSKALHQMGYLYLTGRKDVENAIKYFRRSVSSQRTNFPAWLSLVQTLLGTLPGNEKQVWDTLNVDYWNESQRSLIYFYIGCFHWLMDDRNSAIFEWMNLNHTDSNQVKAFQKLKAMQDGHLWPRSLCFSVQDIQNEIELHYAHEQFIEPLRTMIESALERNDAWNQRQQSRVRFDSSSHNGRYSTRNRTTSDSGEYQYGPRSGGDFVPRSRPVSIADQDMSWRSSERIVHTPDSISQIRNDQGFRSNFRTSFDGASMRHDTYNHSIPDTNHSRRRHQDSWHRNHSPNQANWR